ncbi:hypothetical protein GGI35DRAFT_485048 [Trichoderma velutinum]
MKVRFVGPKKRSQSTEHQRPLQAKRTPRRRERSLISAQSPTEDDQAGQEHSPAPDFGQLATDDISVGDGFISTGQEDGDPEINSIEPEPYYNEETDGLQS